MLYTSLDTYMIHIITHTKTLRLRTILFNPKKMINDFSPTSSFVTVKRNSTFFHYSFHVLIVYWFFRRMGGGEIERRERVGEGSKGRERVTEGRETGERECSATGPVFYKIAAIYLNSIKRYKYYCAISDAQRDWHNRRTTKLHCISVIWFSNAGLTVHRMHLARIHSCGGYIWFRSISDKNGLNYLIVNRSLNKIEHLLLNDI